jgi:hypothetical protein
LAHGAGLAARHEDLAVAAHTRGDERVFLRIGGGAQHGDELAYPALGHAVALALHRHGEIGGDPALLAFPAGGEIGNEYGEHFFCLENHLPVVESRAR